MDSRHLNDIQRLEDIMNNKKNKENVHDDPRVIMRQRRRRTNSLMTRPGSALLIQVQVSETNLLQ